MSTGIYTALKYIGEKLISDAAIDAYCKLKFGKSLSVFIGQDESDLPSEDDAPLVIMTAGGRGLEGGDHINSRSARITKVVKDRLSSKKETLSTGVVFYPGLDLLDEFSDLIDKTITNIPAHSSKEISFQLTEGPDDQIQFPVYKAYAGLTVQIDSNF